MYFKMYFTYVPYTVTVHINSIAGVCFDSSDVSGPCCCCCCWVASVVSDPVRPHRRQPTRLPSPWASPGKNTGVGCYFLLQCMKGKSESEVSQSCLTLPHPMDCSLPGSSVHGIFQARGLEWGAIAFSVSGPYNCMKLSCALSKTFSKKMPI